MADRNTDKDQPPPNPFLLASGGSSLFPWPQGTGEPLSPSSTTTTTTTTGPFAMPTITTTASPFTSMVFAPQSPPKAPAPLFGSSAQHPSSLRTPPKDAASAAPSSIFGNAGSMATASSTLFGGVKRNLAVGKSSPPVKTESAGDTLQPSATASSSSSSSTLFGGSAGGFGGAPVAPSRVFGGGDGGSTSLFSSVSSGGEGQSSSSFGKSGVAADTAWSCKAEGGPSSAPGHQDTGVSGKKETPKLLDSTVGKSSALASPPRQCSKAGKEEAVSLAKAEKGKSRKESRSKSSEFSKKDVTKIIVANIPDNCTDKEFLRSHFSKFGEIVRLILSAHTHQATIIYTDHDGASKAKHKGRKLHPLLPDVKIFYGQPARRRSEEAGHEAANAKKKAIRTLQHMHHTSDIDPYTPLQRSGSESSTILPSIKTAKPRISRLQHTSQTPSVAKRTQEKLSLPLATKQGRNKSPSREAKEPSTLVPISSNLAALHDMVAQNNSDRYNILKARDKLLRRERHRTSDLQQASYLAATCPDMCPELERYMRDVQFDLSSTFEMTDNVMDHRLVTKKFSRSSADKELPLPHELRPGPVLLRTMDFLVCNVINRVDEEGMEVDVWYNYLWNRTRAVRNDLMQQQLTDGTAVAIMERCTRFHIYAAARLCEEPADLYDPKMNTEHLTKSLQTLKELYHDLGERGCYFPTEAEFRAYEMLLNLNDGEAIVTKYTQFREEVQKSSHVQFALKVIQAITFNNYVKFFRLVRRSSTYLQGCLLHRYFRQVRSLALETIIKSHVSPKGTQSIPLHTLTHILGFEGDVEAVLYLQYHGIKTVDGSVVLDKNLFQQSPEEMPPQVRPQLLVEKNCTVSVGEMIQGGPLPDNPLHSHVPYDSFDSHGRLKPEARDPTRQSDTPAEVPLPQQQSEAMQNYALVSHMKDVYSAVESEVLSQMVHRVAARVVEEARQEAAAQSVASELLAEGVGQEVQAVARRVYRAEEQQEAERRRRRHEKEERERKALEEARVAVRDMIHFEYMSQCVEECVRQVCEEAVLEVAQEVALFQLEEELPVVCLGEVVGEEVEALSSEAIQDLRAEQEERVSAFLRRQALRSMAQHFQVWRCQTQKAHRRKESQLTFPAACSSLSLGEQSLALGWGYARDPDLNMSSLQVQQLEASVKDILKKLTLRNQLARECAWHPLPLQQHLAALVAQLPPMQHNLFTQYFKVVLCCSQEVRPEVVVWLRSKLGVQAEGGPRDQDILQPLHSSFSFVSQRSGIEYAWVMREVQATTLTLRDLQGTALVVFVSSQTGPCCTKVRRLVAQVPQASLCEIIFEGDHHESEAEEGKWSLVEEDLVKSCTSDRLQSLMIDSWWRQGQQMVLASSHLNDLVNDTVARHFLQPALRTHNERAADGRSPVPPQALIDLYNGTLDMLQQALAEDRELATLSWPPAELSHLTQAPPQTWNNQDMQRVSHRVASVRLPPIMLASTPLTWASLTHSLHCYAAALSSGGEAPVLASHMDAILSEAWASLEPFLYDEEMEEDWKGEAVTRLELHPLLAPWPQLINACASYRLSRLPDEKVYFQPHKLQHFSPPESWVAACRAWDPAWQEAVKNTHGQASACRKRKARQEEEEEEQRAEKVTKPRILQSQLLDDIAAERRKCEEFVNTLESMLEVEEELKLLFNSSF